MTGGTNSLPLNLSSLQGALQQVVQAINGLNTLMGTIFPLATSSISSTATAGSDTLPASPAGFLNVTINGVAYKLALYKP